MKPGIRGRSGLVCRVQVLWPASPCVSPCTPVSRLWMRWCPSVVASVSLSSVIVRLVPPACISAQYTAIPSCLQHSRSSMLWSAAESADAYVAACASAEQVSRPAHRVHMMCVCVSVCVSADWQDCRGYRRHSAPEVPQRAAAQERPCVLCVRRYRPEEIHRRAAGACHSLHTAATLAVP